jgi:hypothetical protein
MNVAKREKGRKRSPEERPAPLPGALTYTLFDASRLSGLIPIPVAQYRLAQSRIPIEMMCHG